jgi:hypothetical protein
MTSFQRQLNLYGFRRLAKGEDAGAYFHPKFQRNEPDLINQITRLPAKAALETLEEVMNASRAPAVQSQIPRKRSLNSSWVTPIRDTTDTALTKHSASSSTAASTTKRARTSAPVDYDEGLGHYRTRRLAQLEQNVLNGSIDDTGDGTSACTTASAEIINAVTPNANPHLTTNSMGMPLLQIPPADSLYARRRAAAGLSAASNQQSVSFAKDLSLPTPGGNYLFSPSGRDDFIELCPDLIGSPHFTNLMATVSSDYDVLLSPNGIGLSLLNTPIAYTLPVPHFPQAAQRATSSASAAPMGCAPDPLTAALQRAVFSAAQFDPMRTTDLTAPDTRATVRTATSAFTAVPAAHRSNRASAASHMHAPASLSAENSDGAGVGEEEEEDPEAAWLSGHSAEVFDDFLDSMCPTLEAPIAQQSASASASASAGPGAAVGVRSAGQCVAESSVAAQGINAVLGPGMLLARAE